MKVQENNWTELTRVLLAEMMGDQFLIPLEDTDKFFVIEVEDITIQKYAEMIKTRVFKDPLQYVTPKYYYSNNTYKNSFYIPTVNFSDISDNINKCSFEFIKNQELKKMKENNN